MKTILVPVEQHDGSARVLQLAVLTAIRFEGLIEGFALRSPPLPAIEWDAASVAMINNSNWDDRRSQADARAVFETVMGERGIAKLGDAASAAAHGPSWRWNEEPLPGDEFLGSYGRAFDLTVVGQPRSNGSSISTLEAALFESGGPILIAPQAPAAVLGETIVVVWNGSSETARTIAFAKPFLRRARRVVILADNGAIGHWPSGELVQRRLERDGISVELKLLSNGRIRSGEAILTEAAALNCDFLVKGAYTQSRLRQMIFGGVTRHVLEKANMAVFMAH